MKHILQQIVNHAPAAIMLVGFVVVVLIAVIYTGDTLAHLDR